MKDKFVSLTFDDGWKSAVERAYPLLEQYGIPATFYIISSMVDKQQKEYMNREDLHLLASRGHEIGSHTKSHKHLAELSNREILYEINQGLQDLLTLGFSPRTFAYPYGEWNPNIVKRVKEAGFIAARSVEQGINDEFSDPFILPAFAVLEEHSTNEVTLLIQDFMRGRGKWLILYFHQIEPAKVLWHRKWIYGTTPAVLEGILAFIKKQKITAVTLQDGADRLLGTPAR